MNRTPVADWQQLSALYELADTLAPDSLADWLAQLRRQAHPLLEQLEQMLAARSQIERNGFLGAPPRLPLPPEPRVIAWQAGSRIGPYRLLRKIGAGGMAEVWLAQRDDGAFQRQVAIKLLFRHAGSDALDTFAQRFDRERDILASLDHPHIAGLHDAGVTPSGQPWLALEYVEGQTLTSWCDARYLTIEARVRLFRQVLLAVQHAHANLVIHRDLKPGNILVTAQGEVRLLDFGIAKLMEPEGGALVETELTRIAGRPMTPQYASPEQLMGQALTTACDVYSLGVVLYELLCGERPYELKVESTAQLEQAILDTEPRAPSRRALAEPVATARGTTGPMLRKLLASDLDAIVLRALAKQPAQRYASVEAMRADLDRWLAGEPVEARAPSTVYRVGKFVRRHVLSVSLGVGAVAALLGITVVAVLMSVQAREDSARAVAARDFMLNIFQSANQEKSRGTEVTARQLLDLGRNDVLSRLNAQPGLQIELLRGIAKTQSDMGEYLSADSTFTELIRLYRGLKNPRAEAMARADHAFNALQTNNPTLAQRLLDGARAVPGRPRGDAELNAKMAGIEGRIADTTGDPKRAQSILRESRAKAIDALGPFHLQTFLLGRALFRVERELGNFGEALALLDDLRRTSSRVAGLGEGDRSALDLEHVNLLFDAGSFAQALARVDAAMPACVELLGPQEQTCRYLFLKQMHTLVRLGLMERAAKGASQLQAMAQDSTLPFLHVESMLLDLRLRSMASDGGDLSAASKPVRDFGQSGAEISMPSVFKAAALLTLAEMELRAGQPVRSQRWTEAAFVLLDAAGKRSDALRLAGLGHMLDGAAWLQRGRPQEALVQFRAAHADCIAGFGPDHAVTQLFELNTAMALSQLGRVAEAVEIANHAEPILRESFGVGAPTYQRALLLVERLRERAILKDATRFAGGGYGPDQSRQFFR